MLPLGQEVYAEVSRFKGKTYASIRRWFKADDGSWYRTKNGLNMLKSEMLAVLENSAALVDFIQSAEPPAEPEGDVHERGW
jgi:hypothetical protein